MFFAVCDFAALYRAALCAARVEVSAAVSSSGGGIWGVSTPSATPPRTRSRPRSVGVAHARDGCRRRPAEPRSIRDIAE